MRRYVLLFTALVACGTFAPRAMAQEPERRDSLERRITVLEAQIDSLRRIVRQLAAEHRDTTGAAGELAALRARARQLAPEQSQDTVPEPSALRSRNLNQLNPEISVTGDVRVRAAWPGPQQDNVDVREFCFGFQSPLDPYANTKIFFAIGHHVELEEGYVYWTALPAGLRLDVGRFRQQAGELNRWHLHAVPGTEYPLVLREYFGHHGLVGNGVSLYTLLPVTSPGGGVHEIWGQVTLADNDVLFASGQRLSVLGHVNNFWQLSRSSYMQVGGTALYGENPDSAVATRVFGADVRFTWRPPARALYRSFTLRAEGFAVRRRVAGIGDTRYGGYAAAELQLSRRLQAGGRFDDVERLDGVTSVWQTTAYLTWWQSEWALLRAEWQHESTSFVTGGREHANRLVAQVVWAIGPHKHEAY